MRTPLRVLPRCIHPVRRSFRGAAQRPSTGHTTDFTILRRKGNLDAYALMPEPRPRTRAGEVCTLSGGISMKRFIRITAVAAVLVIAVLLVAGVA